MEVKVDASAEAVRTIFQSMLTNLAPKPRSTPFQVFGVNAHRKDTRLFYGYGERALNNEDKAHCEGSKIHTSHITLQPRYFLYVMFLFIEAIE
jgi:hypothetical protein